MVWPTGLVEEQGGLAQPRTFVLPETEPKAYSWVRHLEPALVAAKCNGCHDGTSKIIESRQANRSLTLTETATGISFTYVFNLHPSTGARNTYGYAFGDEFISTYSTSHLGLLGYVMDLEEMGTTRTGDLPRLMLPENFRGSPLVNILKPQQVYPFDADPAKRWRPNMPQHPMEFSPDTLTAYETRAP